MKIFDFGQNTYQYSISFKFDCLDVNTIQKLAHALVVDKKRFDTILKSEQDKATLTDGDGTKVKPFYQLRLREDSCTLGVGWYAGYEKWKEWRNVTLADCLTLLNSIPVAFVSQLSSQSIVTIPPEKQKRPDDLEGIAEIKRFVQRIVPAEMERLVSVVMTVANDKLGDMVDLWTSPAGPGSPTGTISYAVRRTRFDTTTNLVAAITNHCDVADKLFERFNADLLTLVLNE